MTIDAVQSPPLTKRVACVIDELRPGGAETVCAQLAAGVGAAGGAGFVYCLRPGNRPPVHADVAVRCPTSVQTSRWGMIRTMCEWFAQDRIDVVHAHNSAAFVYALGPARRLGLPIVVTRHGSLAGPPTRLLRWADRLLPFADAVVIVADALRDQLPRRVRPERIVHIPNGVPADRASEDAGRRRLAGLCGVIEPVEWVLNVGTISPEKNQPGLARAFARIAMQRPRAHLALVGLTRCRTTHDDVVSLRRELGLGDRVHIVGPQTDIPVLMAGCDVFCISSRSEAMPLALLEAMMQARPIVATRVGDVPAILRHETDGLLVAPADDDALADAVATLLANRPAGRTLGASARARAVRNYTDAATLRTHLDLYEDLTAGAASH